MILRHLPFRRLLVLLLLVTTAGTGKALAGPPTRPDELGSPESISQPQSPPSTPAESRADETAPDDSTDGRSGLDQGGISFGRRFPIQHTSPGSLGVPIRVDRRNERLEVQLFPLTPADFAARYAPAGSGARRIDPEGLEPALGWTVEIGPNYWEPARIPLPPEVASGLYLLEARREGAGEGVETFLIHHDVALVARRGRRQVMVWAARPADGEPATGVPVHLLDAAGEVLGSATTDSQGVARLLDHPGASFVTAETQGGRTITGLDARWRRRYADPSRLPAYVGHLHTDRPIYRPGQTVHYKATLRRFGDSDAELIAPTGALSLTVKDARGNRILEQAAEPDAYGSVAGQLILSDEPALGEWKIEIDTAGLDAPDAPVDEGAPARAPEIFTGRFHVEEYVRPDYEVQVAAEASDLTLGETVEVTVGADYYFGAPVADAELVLRLLQDADDAEGGLELQRLELRTGADGTWQGDLELGGPGATPGSWTLVAEVTDAGRRPVAGRAELNVHLSPLVLDLELPRRAVAVGEPVGATLRLRDQTGQPVAGRALDFEAWRIQGIGDRSESSVLVHEAQLQSGADGSAAPDLSGLPAGNYRLKVRAEDAAGLPLEASASLWRYSPAAAFDDEGGLRIESDRPTYAPGDTAYLLVRAPRPTRVLLVLEREDVYIERELALDGAQVVELPVEAGLAPWVMARVFAWLPQSSAIDAAEAWLRDQGTRIEVRDDRHRLQVEVLPDQAMHQPGETAGLTLRVRDAAGEPVAAQLSLALVDASLLALKEDPTQPFFEAFWGERRDRMTSFDTLKPSHWDARMTPTQPPRTYTPTSQPMRTNTPPPWPTRAPGQPTATPAPADAGGEDEAPALVPRRDFPETAYWNALLETGQDGMLHLDIHLPDNLTTWQAIARAVALDGRLGEGRGEFLATQPISADPALPRFTVVGDELILDVLAHNRTGEPQSGSCVLETTGYAQLDEGERRLEIPVSGPAVASWSVVASQVGIQTIRARLDTPAGTDYVEHRLETQAFGVPERFAMAGSTEDSAFELFELPFKAVPEDTEVEIRVTPRLLVGILDGVGELVRFPHGCVEQTMTKMLPNAVVARLAEQVELPPSKTVDQLPEFMDAGLQKLYGFQRKDGSWGWWQGGRNLYISTWVLHGLTLSEQAGFAVDPDVRDRGLDWLQSQAMSSHDPQVAAYAAYVLAEAGRPYAAWMNRLLQDPEHLDAFGAAALALGLDRAGEPAAARQALDLLIAQVEEEGEHAYWSMDAPEDGRWYAKHWDTMASDEKSTGTAILALARLEPGHRLIPKAIDWLLARRTGAGWNSTQSTAFSLLALTERVSSTGDLAEEMRWTVRVDEQVVLAGSTNDEGPAPTRVVLGAERLSPGRHEVYIAKQGEGRLHYVVSGKMTLFNPGFASVQAAGLGIELGRDYASVDAPDRPAGEPWATGELVNVRLSLNLAEPAKFLIIEDFLPAGLEAIDSGLATESPFRTDPGMPWLWSGYERKEVHDEGVIFFSSALPAGQHVFDYPARAITPGRFSARPAEAYAMYRPEVWGRSGSARVEISPERLRDRPDLPGDLDRDCRLTAFDAALVADAWAELARAAGGSAPPGAAGDLNHDRRLDAADIALALHRAGLGCGETVPRLPEASAGDVELVLSAPDDLVQGAIFEVVIRAAGGLPSLSAWQLALDLPEGAYELVSVADAPGLADPRRLGPFERTEAGRTVLRLGGFLPEASGLAGNAELTRLRLRALQGGPRAIAITDAVLAAEDGAAYRVTADGLLISPKPWRPGWWIYLPAVWPRPK